MKLGESIQTYNPIAALKRETGTFQVTTPGGEELTVTCKPGDSIANIQWATPENNKPFVVTKLYEPVNYTEHVAPIRQAG